MIALISDIIKRGELINEFSYKSKYYNDYPITYTIKIYRYTAYMIEILYENHVIDEINIKAI